MTEPARRDWPQIIRDLEAAGVTLWKISILMHRQFGMIQRWRDGQEPRHYEGEMLLAIYAEYVPCETFENKPNESDNANLTE